MEKTPKHRKHSCLTLNKKHCLSDSPKTSLTITESPDCFDTVSSSSSPQHREYNNNSPYSTPIARKRSHFFEESPSQDYDNYNIILPSQDVQSNILDVGWKWDESPKAEGRNKTVLKNKKKYILKPSSTNIEKNGASKLIKKQIEIEKNDERHGFYKFKEELLKIKSSKTWQQDCNELDSNLKENTYHTTKKDDQMEVKSDSNSHIEDIQILEEKSEKSSSNECEMKSEDLLLNESFNDKYNNLFNDSDTDNLLIELSQKVEAEIESKIKIEEKKITNEHKKTIDLIKFENDDNDSFDDVLLSLRLPDDKNIERPKNEGLQNKIKLTSNEIKKNAFARYNSMPVSPTTNPRIKNTTKTFVRHSSMPENKMHATVAKPNVVVSSTGKCESNKNLNQNKPKTNFSNSEEIEKRKQEAKQRLMLTMQRILQQQQNHKNPYQNTKTK